MTHSHTFVARLRGAGVEPGDPDELRIKKSIMVFAMGLMTVAPMVWLALYWLLGLQLSATLPFAFQLISVLTLAVYIMTGGFRFFQYAQLGLFLFFPFVAQLSIGNFISASGVVLWGILAPIVAVAVLGPRLDALFPVFHLTHRSHPALLRSSHVLAVILLRQSLAGEAAAGDAPEQKGAHGFRMTQGEKQRGPATGRAAADDGGKGAQLPEQLVNVVGPDLIFRINAIDDDIGRTAVAPVEDDDAVAALGHAGSEQLDAADIAPAAGR